MYFTPECIRFLIQWSFLCRHWKCAVAVSWWGTTVFMHRAVPRHDTTRHVSQLYMMSITNSHHEARVL